MKLRNLMYATMIACAFASCSKDDENIPDGGQTAADATLSIKAFGAAGTKAGGANGTVKDETITTLDVYVFESRSGGYIYETKGTATAAELSGNKIEKTKVKAGDKQVIVIANAPAMTAPAEGTTIENFMDQVIAYADKENSNNLTMNSQVFQLYAQAGKENALGYETLVGAQVDAVKSITDNSAVLKQPIWLYRNVAKVILSEISIKGQGSSVLYPNAKLKVEQVFILNAREYSKLATAEPWGVTTAVKADATKYLNGVDGTTYAGWATTTGDKKVKPYLSDGYNATAYARFMDSNIGKTVDNSKAVTFNNLFYVYENEVTTAEAADVAGATYLVIEGKFYPNGVTEGAVAESVPTSYYTVAVGIDGTVVKGKLPEGIATGDVVGIRRNMQYNISLTVNGPGYETPFGPKLDDKTFLDVVCKVAEWGFVNQSTEI